MCCSCRSTWVSLLFAGFIGSCNADVFLAKEPVHLKPNLEPEHDLVPVIEHDLGRPRHTLTEKRMLRRMPWCQVKWWSGLLREALCGSMDEELVVRRTDTSTARGAWLEFGLQMRGFILVGALVAFAASLKGTANQKLSAVLQGEEKYYA